MSDGNKERLADIRMVPFAQVEELGMSEKFVRLLEEGLPDKGSYQGEYHRFWNGREADRLLPHQ